jgi:hypothetical protein
MSITRSYLVLLKWLRRNACADHGKARRALAAQSSFCVKMISVLLLADCFTQSGFSAEPATNDTVNFGFLYSDFSLTLDPGRRTEIFGPSFYSQQKEDEHTWAIPPLTFAHVEDPITEAEEYDFAYPLLTYDRFGKEYRWQFFQLFSFAGGVNPDDSSTRRFTLFPIYFQQRSTDPRQNYTAFVPFGGHLNHRLFKDDIYFVMFPFYAKTRKKDVITYDEPYPFFHRRYGDGLFGWQLWPFYGREHKSITTTTNDYGDPLTIPGHDSRFIAWPFFTESTNGIGGDVVREKGLLPFYTLYRSKLRDSTTYSWPLGVTKTIDREKKYVEWDEPWPLIEFAHGEGKTERRIWPFYSKAHNAMLTDNWYMWPVYKYNRVFSPPLDRSRTRILFFLYNYVDEKSTETGRSHRRADLWPLYTWRHDFNGNERLQVMAIPEPFFPNNKSIERDYSPLYSFWIAEKNPRAGTTSQSLLWNLYRRETAPHVKKISLLFGLFQYQSSLAGKRWRLFYIPAGRSHAVWPHPAPQH